MSKFVLLYPLGLHDCFKVRKSELPENVTGGPYVYYMQLPKPPLPILELSRGDTGRCKLGERGTMLRYWNDKQWAKSPWQHISKLHWRNSRKAKSFAHRTARRKAKILLRQDAEGETNFKMWPGLNRMHFD